jgi:hypothetical protein
MSGTTTNNQFPADDQTDFSGRKSPFLFSGVWKNRLPEAGSVRITSRLNSFRMERG